jgi:hypothetical protein
MAEQVNSRPDSRMRKSGCGCGGGRKRQVVSGQKETSDANAAVAAEAAVEVDGAKGTIRVDEANVADAAALSEGTASSSSDKRLSVKENVQTQKVSNQKAEASRPVRVQAGTKPLLNKAEVRRNEMRKQKKRS